MSRETSKTSLITELPQRPTELSLVSGDPAQDAHLKAVKRETVALEIDQFPSKRARLKPTDTQQPGIKDGKADQVGSA